MNNWTLEPFGKLADFKNGLNFRAGETGHELKVLGVGDFKERTKLEQVTDISSIHTEKKIDKSYLLQDGDLVFVRSNGNPALVGRCMQIFTNNEDISFSGFTIRARLKTDKTTPEFISLLMQGGLLKNILKRDGRGTNISNLNQDILSKLQIPIPSKAEQMELLSVFGYWDKAIEKTEALIAAKEKQFEWLISELISKPNDEKKENWRQVKLGDIGEISSAGVDKKIIKGEIPVRLINYLDVYRSDFIVSKNITHQVTAPAVKASKCATQKGDIFFTPSSELRGDIGHSSVAIEDMPDAVYSYHVVRLRLHENWDLKYRAYAFKARNFFKQAYKYADGSGQRYVISQNNFRKMEICVPPLETQQKISNILYEAQKEIHLLKKTLEQYRSQKRGLMQKLLTGEWQVGSSQHLSEETYQEASA